MLYLLFLMVISAVGTSLSPAKIKLGKFVSVVNELEPALKRRDATIRKSIGGWWHVWYRLRGMRNSDISKLVRHENKVVDEACSIYENYARDSIRSHGLDVHNFNQMLRTVVLGESAPQKVEMHSRKEFESRNEISASVPRLAEGIKSTDLHPSRLPRTTILPPFSWRWRGRSVGEGPVDPIALSPQQRNDKLDQFSRCLVDIEKERLKNLDLLQTKLHLPSNISMFKIYDPKILPLLSSGIQKSFRKFSDDSHKVLAKHKLLLSEFDELVELMDGNYWWWAKVKYRVHQLS